MKGVLMKMRVFQCGRGVGLLIPGDMVVMMRRLYGGIEDQGGRVRLSLITDVGVLILGGLEIGMWRMRRLQGGFEGEGHQGVRRVISLRGVRPEMSGIWRVEWEGRVSMLVDSRARLLALHIVLMTKSH